MSLTKDVYFDQVEAEIDRLVEQGWDPDDAYEAACETAYEALGETMADLADRAHQARKDEG